MISNSMAKQRLLVVELPMSIAVRNSANDAFSGFGRNNRYGIKTIMHNPQLTV